ncbi:YceD family protein [Dechloromonas sp. ZS-1]|uniref:YceD family protein n=1 Tax=Dechloromonas sp. ZS-1 TaxID=3138067 RepID=UPI0031FD7D14
MKKLTDAFVFAREGRVLEGTLPVSSLERLHDLLVEVGGEVVFRLEGYKGKRGEAMLHLTVTGSLPLICQRCLAAVSHDLDVDNLLELVPEGADLSQDELEDDTRDFLPVVKELDVAELVEDEILLALPVAPRHEKCGLPGAADAGERVNPFATLAALKGKPN